MPVRLLREGILTSDRVDLLDPEAEVFYRRLMSVVDDWGRFDGRPAIILTATYPLRVSADHRFHTSAAKVSKWLDACARAGLLIRYVCEGKPYIEVLFFKQQVRAKASKYPNPPSDAGNAEQVLSTPPADAKQMRATAHLDGDEDGDEDGIPPPAKAGGPPTNPNTGKPAKTTKPKSTKVPPTLLDPNFAVSEAVAKWAVAKGYDRLAEHLEAFKRKCMARSYAYSDWDAAFQEAIREDWAKLRRGANGAPPPENAVRVWHENSQSVMDRGAELGLTWDPGVWYAKHGTKHGWAEYKDAVLTRHETALRESRNG